MRSWRNRWRRLRQPRLPALPASFRSSRNYFGVQQVAARIRLPVIARSGLGARAEVSVAHRQPLAGRAAALEQRLAVAQPAEQLDARIGPDRREGTLANRTDRMR